MLPLLAALAPVALGGIQTLMGMSARQDAEAAARANQRPEYNIPQEEYQNLALAQSRAGQGMSEAARQQLLNQTNQSQAANLSALMKGGGDANAISGTVNNTQNALNQNAVYEDQARLQNLAGLTSAYTRMSANKDKAWQLNQYQPYADRAQAIAQQLAGANNMVNSGLNTAFSGVMGGLNHMAAGEERNNLYSGMPGPGAGTSYIAPMSAAPVQPFAMQQSMNTQGGGGYSQMPFNFMQNPLPQSTTQWNGWTFQ